MALAISRPAGNPGSDAGREIRIDEIHIHRNVESAGTTGGQPHRLVHHRAHPAFVEFAHRNYAYAGRLERDGLFRVYASRADQHAIFGVNFRSESADARQFWRVVSEN